MIEFQRITTEYVGLEDRLRITGETKTTEVVEMWLTQRLLLRLLPPIFTWLEKQTLSEIQPTNANKQTKEMLQVLAQQTASAELKNQEPVKAVQVVAKSSGTDQMAETNSSFVIESVDLNRRKDVIQLVFKSKSSKKVNIVLRAQPLRQWLAIIRTQWQRADWPITVWPKWVTESLKPESNQTSQAVH
jgi:hypothetical protein